MTRLNAPTLRKAGRHGPVYGSVRFSVAANRVTGVAVTLKRGALLQLRKRRRLAATAVVVTSRSAPAPALSLSHPVLLRS